MSIPQSLPLERQALAALFQYPKIYPDLFFTKESDFYHPVHRLIYGALVKSILNKELPNHVLISSRLAQNGISSFEDGLSIRDYVESLSKISVAEKSALDFFKELATLKVKRNIIEIGSNLINAAKKTNDKESLQDIVNEVDRIYSRGMNESLILDGHGPKEIFELMEPMIEDLGNNPPDPKKLLPGPFPSLNEMFGTLHKRGAVNCIAARTGVGKTSLTLFYHIWMAEQYNLPILWMDFGEMTPEELLFKAAASMTNGLVPIYEMESGRWRNNKKYTEALRAVWPRAKKIKYHYIDVSDMNESQIISAARRYQYNQVGRGNPFLWVFDYLKPFDEVNHNTPEWKQMGAFIKNIKNFVKSDTGDINTSFNTCLQLNRSGITTNKFSKDVDDSENAFSVSDRISQQCSLAFIVRNKTNDEFQMERGQYGNLKMIWVKTRYLGEHAERALQPVTLPDGRVVRNFINLKGKNFFYEDLGDLHTMIRESADIFDPLGQKDDPHAGHNNIPI